MWSEMGKQTARAKEVYTCMPCEIPTWLLCSNKISVKENLENRRVNKKTRLCYVMKTVVTVKSKKCNWEVRETVTSHPKFQSID